MLSVVECIHDDSGEMESAIFMLLWRMKPRIIQIEHDVYLNQSCILVRMEKERVRQRIDIHDSTLHCDTGQIKILPKLFHMAQF